MAFPRRSIASWATLLRQRSSATLRTANARQAGRQSRVRGYASSSGGGAAKKSDLPWLLGAVGVTAPALWYIGIWTPDPNAHYDHEGHEVHDESKADEGEESAGESEEDKGDDGSSKDNKGDTKDDAKIDPASPAKPAGSQNQMSGKQEGVANADTRHSTDPANDPGQSDKPEGGPDTAKAKGTVDTARQQK